MVNNGYKRSSVGQSTHCTSFGVCKQLPLPNFKPPSDLNLALKNVIIKDFKNSQLCNNYIKLINSLPKIKTIEPKNYLILFKILLYLEDHEFQLLNEKHNLKSQNLRYVSNTFVIIVPTLDEDDPFINIGDKVRLYVINLNCNYYCKVANVIGKKVYLSPLNQSSKSKLLNQTVDVYFCTTNWSIRCSHYVLHIMYKYNLISLVYPKISTNLYNLSEVDQDWFHKSISENPEQKTTINNILNNSAYPAPYILFGPPGTGKTTTLVEAIYQIRKQYKTKNILVCTFSNAAADEITKRLLLSLPHKDIFRMYASSIHWSNVDKEIDLSSNFIDDEVLYLPKEIFILKKVVITTLVTCIRLVNLKLQNDHFSYIFIDEASQSTELESLIPLTIMNPKSKTEAIHAQIIIAGDPHQLGPVVKCKKVEHLLGKSLLERLMECEPYQKVNNKYNSRYITKLVRNYRSQEAIIYTSNKLFYNNELLCYKNSNTDNITSGWTLLSNRTFPIIFFVVKGKEIRASNMSVYNNEEVTIITKCTMELMNSKLGHRKIKQEDIGIVTPFKQQKIMIQKTLSEHKLNDITIGTVETFQGQEKEIILLSTVRSQCFEHNGKQHIGFLSNPKRFNVALTRAKNLLIIVGNPSVLCRDRHWNTLWQYCKKNNAYNTDYTNI